MGNVAVLGAGAWGTALAKLLAEKGENVRMWAKDAGLADDINRTRTNPRYFPGFELPPSLRGVSTADEALDRADMVLLVVPSHATRDVLKEIGTKMPKGVPLVSATKGIENDSLMLMRDVLEDVLGAEYAKSYTALSGPSFAKEVASHHPTAVVVAGKDQDVVHGVQSRFACEYFRTYSSEDIVGVETAGALKNVIAIAAGAADGLGFGYNTRAALITRGLAEIARVAVAKGGSPLTVAGLAGMGDLVLTCTGELSRNRTVGVEIGKGKKLDDVLRDLGHVAEGVKTAKSAHNLAKKLNVEMPITEQVYCCLFEGKPASDALRDLMARALRPEIDF